MYLTDSERTELKLAARLGIGAIDVIVHGLHRSNPNAFHTSESVTQRIFVHQPAEDIPLAEYLYAARHRL